ncbi:hypothetical protein Tco_0564554 [Tanacetum coccineum]
MVAFLKKPEGSEGFHQIVDFLNSTHINTSENREMEIIATIDGRVKTVTEASIKRHLKLEDSDGISTLPNTKILEQLALIGYVSNSDRLTFQKGTFFLSVEDEGSTVPVESHHIPTNAPSTSKPPTSPPFIQITHVAEEAANMPHNSPLPRVHSLGSDEGCMTLHELTVLCTTLSKKVESLESDLKQTKLTYGAAYTKLIMKVKKLKNRIKSNNARRRVRLIVSEDKGDLEDLSKQGRKIAQLDEDKGITLVHMGAQTQGRHEHDLEPDFEFTAPEEVYTVEPDISTANVPVSIAGAKVSTASPEVKTGAESLVYIKRSAAKRKDKGKTSMKEADPIQKKTKLQPEQERLGYKEALRLQEKLDEEERQRIARVHEKANTFNAEEWDNIQAQIKVIELVLNDRLIPKISTGSSKRTAETELDHEGSKRVGNHTEAYQTFDDMLKKFDRDDLDKLWSLVKERFSSTNPTDDKERTLWVELKRLFEPDIDDIMWKLQRYMHDPLTWRLYDTCGVHHVSTDRGHDIFMLVEKDYPLTRGILTLMLCNKLQVDQYSEMANELLKKIFILANRPRQ